MKSIAQLFRQPIRTLSGILLVALATAVLCVCIGQAAAAANMRTAIEESYHTVALPTNKYHTGEYAQEVLDWIDQAVEEYPDIIQSDSYAGLASAYIQELHPDNHTNYLNWQSETTTQNSSLRTSLIGMPYTCAMLEITLERIDRKDIWETGEVAATLRGTVERVIGLEQGFNDPTGYGVILYMEFPDSVSYEKALSTDLIVGQRYLTYGMDYQDKDWILRSIVAKPKSYGAAGGGFALPGTYDGLFFDKFLPENLHFFGPDTEEEWQEMIDSGRGTENVAYYRFDYIKEDGKKGSDVTCFNAIMMMNLYQKVSYTLIDYSTVSGSIKDRTPTIALLTGTAEEFLSSQEGALWQETLDNLQISNQSFPVVGVENLTYIGNFAKQNAVIAVGRDFTSEELSQGAPVCVISSVLAQANDLSIGDTITLQYYDHDMDSPAQAYINENEGIINTGAYYFTSNTPYSGDPVEYTVVGFYDQTSVWDHTESNIYAFSPNTIFVPKSSVSADMDHSYMGMYRTLVLPNGGIDEFETLLSMSGMEGLFLCYDQGYTDIIDNLYSYELIARQALNVGLVIYAIVMLLYFVLFPTRQGKVISQMAAMGATRLEKLRHVNVSALGILIPGSAVGVTVGIALRQRVMDALTASASVVLPLEMDIESLIYTGIAQLLLASTIALLISLPMTRDRSLMKRRTFLERFSKLRKTPLYTWAVMILALIVSAVLCGLTASNEAEMENYQLARKEIPITITVTDPSGDQSTGLELDTWVLSILTGEFSWGLSDYLTDIRIEFPIEPVTINGLPADRYLHGMMSVNCAKELLPVTDSYIHWYDGYDASIFTGNEPVCIVPEGYSIDADPDTQAQELTMQFSYTDYTRDSMGVVLDSRTYDYEVTLTVVGTYHSSLGADGIYCPFAIADTIATKIAVGRKLDSAAATLKDNESLEDFWTAASKYFLEPGPDAKVDGRMKYGLLIDTSALEKAEAVLNNSITINRISTLLVFILSAGAGFFVGFLMIRSRKREIILMRTLGRSNFSIYLDFMLEQIGYIVVGAVAGGIPFLWHPVEQLILFILIYSMGLTTALILFLNSKLITNMKEDE